MENHLNLVKGASYQVIKSFTDYDNNIHQVGEVWIYLGTNYHFYDNGLTLYVIENNENKVYRLQDRDFAQQEVINNFNDYIEQL